MKLSRKLALTLHVAAMIALAAALVPMMSSPAQAQSDPTASITSPTGGIYSVASPYRQAHLHRRLRRPGHRRAASTSTTRRARRTRHLRPWGLHLHRHRHEPRRSDRDHQHQLQRPRPPTASISSPASGGTYSGRQSVPTSFSCSDSTYGPGIQNCVDQNDFGEPRLARHIHPWAIHLYGGHDELDGQTGTSYVNYAVAAPPTASKCTLACVSGAPTRSARPCRQVSAVAMAPTAPASPPVPTPTARPARGTLPDL